MLIINNDDVAQLLAMADCIRVQEEAFKKLPAGGAMHRPRIDMYMPCDQSPISKQPFPTTRARPPGSPIRQDA